MLSDLQRKFAIHKYRICSLGKKDQIIQLFKLSTCKDMNMKKL